MIPVCSKGERSVHCFPQLQTLPELYCLRLSDGSSLEHIKKLNYRPTVC